MFLIKNKKTILGIVLISLFIIGFSATSVNAYIDEGGGGGVTTYTSTKTATRGSTRSATMIGTASSTATATAKIYDFETLQWDYYCDEGTVYDINLHSSETRSATASAFETRYATRSATRTRSSTVSQAAADAAALVAAQSAAQLAANAAALAAAQSAALAAAQSVAQSQAGIYASNFAIEEASLAVNYAYPSSPVDNSLVTVHGFSFTGDGGGGVEFYCFDSDPRFSNWYGASDIKHVHYYNGDPRHQIEFDGITSDTDLYYIANALKNLLIRWHNEGEIKDNIDIMAHSMGGLVTRAMIKLYYQDLADNGITINHIATLGTPNYGVSLANLVTIFGGLVWEQILSMAFGSSFLTWLNEGDDTPHSVLDVDNIQYHKDIIWSTFAGEFLNLGFDGLVDTWFIQLHENDVTNYGVYSLGGHCEYWLDENVVGDLYYEMTKQGFTKPQSSETLPGDLTIEPLSGDTYRIKMVLTEDYNPEVLSPWCRVVINNKAYSMNVEQDDYRFLDEWENWVIVHEYHYNYFDIVIPQGEAINFYCMAPKENGCDWYRMTPINGFVNW